MENMDKGLTVPKWVLMNRQKYQMPQNLSAKLSAQAQMFGTYFDEKKASLGFRSPCSGL